MTKPKSSLEKANAQLAKNRAEKPRELTAKEREFCLHYMGAANRIATEAVILAYGPRERISARRYGHEVMQRPPVVAEIARLTDERNERLAVTSDDVLRRLLALEAEATTLPKSVQTLKLRREIVKDMGEHVAVGAFRRQVGLSSPTGGPIETADAEWLAHATDEELDELERARSIIDRRAGRAPEVPDGRGDTGGEGAAEEGAGG